MDELFGAGGVDAVVEREFPTRDWSAAVCELRLRRFGVSSLREDRRRGYVQQVFIQREVRVVFGYKAGVRGVCKRGGVSMGGERSAVF